MSKAVAKKQKSPKGFYEFDQNNSGGGFDVNDRLRETVIIEAFNADDAADRAERVGIYFDGCDSGQDCPCCGDRWYRPYRHEAEPVPSRFTTPLKLIVPDTLKNETGVNVVIYYLDGSKGWACAPDYD